MIMLLINRIYSFCLILEKNMKSMLKYAIAVLKCINS